MAAKPEIKAAEPAESEAYTTEQISGLLSAYKDDLEFESEKHAIEAFDTLKGHTLYFKFINNLNEDKFVEMKSNLHAHLTQKTSYAGWQFETEIVVQETKVKLHKTQDKYKAMLDKNPSLGHLKEVMNLDLEY